MSLFTSGATYQYYSSVRFVNESNTGKIPIPDTGSGALPDIHHSHLRRKPFLFVSPGDTSPPVSPYADISSVSPLSCFMISVLYGAKGVSRENRRKKKSLKRNTTCIFIHRLSSFIPGCLIHALAALAALATCHLAAPPARSYSCPFIPFFFSLRLAYSFFTCDCKSVKVILSQSNPL